MNDSLVESLKNVRFNHRLLLSLYAAIVVFLLSPDSRDPIKRAIDEIDDYRSLLDDSAHADRLRKEIEQKFPEWRPPSTGAQSIPSIPLSYERQEFGVPAAWTSELIQTPTTPKEAQSFFEEKFRMDFALPNLRDKVGPITHFAREGSPVQVVAASTDPKFDEARKRVDELWPRFLRTFQEMGEANRRLVEAQGSAERARSKLENLDRRFLSMSCSKLGVEFDGALRSACFAHRQAQSEEAKREKEAAAAKETAAKLDSDLRIASSQMLNLRIIPKALPQTFLLIQGELATAVASESGSITYSPGDHFEKTPSFVQLQLMEDWDKIRDRKSESAQQVLARRAEQTSTASVVLGLTIHQDAFGLTTTIAIWLLLTYFYLNVRHTYLRWGNSREPDLAEFPWPGLYGGRLSAMVLVVTILVAPLGLTLVNLIRVGRGPINAMNWVQWIALPLIAATAVAAFTVTLRLRRAVHPRKPLPEQTSTKQ